MTRLFVLFIAFISASCSGQQPIHHYPIKNMLGVNSHNWDMITGIGEFGPAVEQKAIDKVNAIVNTGFSSLRIYIDAEATKDQLNNSFIFSPDGRGFSTDQGIQTLKSKNPNLKILYCYQNMPKNIKAEWEATGKKSTQYRHPNTDPSNSATWTELANDLAVITARGGNNTNVSDYPVFVSPNWWEPKQVMSKGTGLYDILEIQNELCNPWSNDYPLSGYQYALLWKTAHDAIKAVDPSMLVSTTGVTSDDAKILKEAIAWSKTNNGGRLPFDFYQFHCYPWGWSKGIANALPPELNVFPAVKKMISAAGEVPCIIGEWGFDLNSKSDIGIRPFSGYTAEQVRGYWIARAILGFAVSGLHSAYYYQLYQPYGFAADASEQLFATSGMFVEENNLIYRRFSGDVFKQLSKFGEFVLDSVVVEDESKRVYRFKDGTQYLYTGWTIERVEGVEEPNRQWTTKRAKVREVKSNYSFPKGIRLDFQTGDSMASQPFAGGVIELSTKPVFVLVEDPKP